MPGQHAKEVVLLVGGNPLPNYVAARTLRAQRGIERVHLLYTNEVKEVKHNLLKCLVDRDKFDYREPTLIKDAGDAEAIQDACCEIVPGSHLHYTGGTNSMAVHVHATWMREKNGTPDQASYLFGKEDRLMTDAGESIEIAGIQLDLDTLSQLHGLEDNKQKGRPCFPGDINETASQVFEDPSIAGKLPLAVPDNLKGVWLEDWVAEQVQETGLVSSDHLHTGIKKKIKERDFELDVVAIRGHHLYLISCTTSHKTTRCKSKLFEVAMRARQLGGDLARSALVCLADRDKEGNDVVEELRKDVRSLSESSRVPHVFGLKDVREWAGFHGSTPNLETLKDWLTDKK